VSILRRIFGSSPAPSTNCANGDFAVEVVGESNYQQALTTEAAQAQRGQFPVELIPEPSNRHDSNAVRVCSRRDQTLGYLSADMAEIAQAAIKRFKTAERSWPSCTAKLVGGEPGRETLGIWLDLDLYRLGIGPPPAPRTNAPPGFRTGLSEATATDEEDDSYDLSWMGELTGDLSADVATLRRLLRTDADPIARHYLFSELERRLYRAREAFGSALDEFDRACVEHDAEMDGIRDALVAKFGKVPMLETYKQAAIRHQKAGDWLQVVRWAQHGIDLYGDLAADPLWSQDLMTRRDRAASKPK
jgi:hypothetical protein